MNNKKSISLLAILMALANTSPVKEGANTFTRAPKQHRQRHLIGRHHPVPGSGRNHPAKGYNSITKTWED